MSTRGLYTFKANPTTAGEMDWNIYKHSDNYPTGAADAILDALPYAWELPRYESDEFSAAFIAANKIDAGGVKLMPQGKPLSVASKHCSYIDYRYEIYLRGAACLYVRCYDVSIIPYGSNKNKKPSEILLFDVSIDDLKSAAKGMESRGW